MELSTANTIRDQIGRVAFMMLGTDLYVGGKDSLTFNVKGSKKANRIRVTLTPDDLYTVEAFKIRGAKCETTGTVEFVFANQLKTVIESLTGLYTRF